MCIRVFDWYRRKDQTNEIYILHTDLPFTRALILGTKPWFSWWFRIVNGNSDQESLHNDKELLNNGGYTHSPDTGWGTDVYHTQLGPGVYPFESDHGSQNNYSELPHRERDEYMWTSWNKCHTICSVSHGDHREWDEMRLMVTGYTDGCKPHDGNRVRGVSNYDHDGGGTAWKAVRRTHG